MKELTTLMGVGVGIVLGVMARQALDSAQTERLRRELQDEDEGYYLALRAGDLPACNLVH